MQFTETGSPAYRRILMSMLLGSLVTFAILYSPQTLIATFAQQFQIPPSTASLIISFATVTLAVSMLFVSMLSNAWGRKKMMALSLFITSVLAIISSFSWNFHILLAVRLLEGISLAGFPAIAMTYLSEEISPRSIGRVMGVYVGGTAIGGFAGRVIISAFTDLFSWQVAFLVLGLVSLVCSSIFWYYLPESRNFRRSEISFQRWLSGFRIGFTNKRLLGLYGCGFLLLGVYVTMFNYISYPLSKPPYELSQTWIGLLFIFQLVGSWSSFMFGKWTERYSRVTLMIWAIIMLLGGAIITLLGNLLLLVVGITVFALGFFAGHTIASGWIGAISPPGGKAYASSLYLLFYYTGSSLVGWLGGLFLASLGWSGVILMIGGLVLLVAALLLQIARPQPAQANS
ncbi:MFS transporter [Paenibacillus thalictri]|uniref:MFS transporter n=1 Tax=Paenibacillus thalictri TaxID=2527873 RepID=A0A4Q9DKP1_9BACL|nr:MFS transporter [Paenibacillus thalictri]TBL72719.1 MFS transporter [Paenibacillus thalictri]